MTRSQPYQPLALRTLHGSISALIVIALLTGVLIYNSSDRRFGYLPIPTIPKIESIHKLFGRVFLLVIPFFAIYSFGAGRHRLIQPDSIKRLKSIGKPIWWYTLHRIVNTFMLLGATLALVSGREMQVGLLGQGELKHTWYTLHLVSWLLIFGCLAMHLLMIAKIGGVPLMISIFSFVYRPKDRPAILVKSFCSWFSPKWLISWLTNHLKIQKYNIILLVLELIVMAGITFAWMTLIPHRG
jgi:hypothetical protein